MKIAAFLCYCFYKTEAVRNISVDLNVLTYAMKWKYNNYSN